ncbi:BspA family leucine-rich repeat surface protein [Pedobacter puniceum]|uniref:BspA family leucine-rich repeat surface protein n=1 Tax=Pedobacter puniceum TaxID=2666136 RepID=A0A7K0FLP5_9SPHI|nr:BspA family leucine-rich repeat surface protein [Pedobacter puniceum]MRX46894.1 BspA family leucine-rich repeat surface protein [Pedobacter puniceum]
MRSRLKYIGIIVLLTSFVNINTYAQFIIKVNTQLGTGNSFTLTGAQPNTNVNIIVKDITGTTTLASFPNVSAARTINNNEIIGNPTSYQIEYSNVTRINFNNGGDRLKLTEVVQWGTSTWSSFQNAFSGCSNLTSVSIIDAPILGANMNLSAMFLNCTLLNVGNFNGWNVSTVVNMQSLFQSASAFNQPLNNWNTSLVTTMANMFQNASAFNQPLDNWNTSLVNTMANMFSGASSFNQNINVWNVGNVINMSGMFQNARNFNQPLNSWNTANVTNMSSMFSGAPYTPPATPTIIFNQDISSWNTSRVTNMSSMFSNNRFFNQPIGNWNTSLVTNMLSMFQSATAFNQPLGNWNTSLVTNMASMFQSAIAFDQPIGNWNTSLVTTMASMFSGASSFNQNIGSWNTANVTAMNNMFQSATVFNQSLNNWNTANVTAMNNMFQSATVFNQPLNNWNTANVTAMNNMFQSATAFNQPIGNWNTSKVTTMASMFLSAIAFDQPIGNWNTSLVTTMASMFNTASSFNQNIGSWDVRNVTTMAQMFNNAVNFNGPIGNWDTDNLNTFNAIFQGAINFNQPIGNWKTGKVTNFSSVFNNARAFNQNINSWDTGLATTMASMFQNAYAFNQPLDNWNTANVTNMQNMFLMAPTQGAFNQSLATFDISKVTTMAGMLNNTNMSVENYDQTLVVWASKPRLNGVQLGASGRGYCFSLPQRQSLITTNGWIITGDILACAPGGVSTNLSWWLDADRNTQNGNTPTNNGPIDFWGNRSLQATTPNSLAPPAVNANPMVVANSLNFNPVIRFDGIDDVLQSVATNSGYRSSTFPGQQTAYIVGRFNGGNQTLFSHQGTANPVVSSSITTSNVSYTNNGATIGFNYNNPLNDTQIKVISLSPPINATSAGTFLLNRNGLKTDSIFIPIGGLLLPNTTGIYRVGADAIGNNFAGDIAEMIFYRAPTNNLGDTINRRRILTYLAIKWGISLGANTAFNYESTGGTFVVWEGNTRFQNNIAGIGRDELTTLNQKQSQSINSGNQLIISLGEIAADNDSNTNNFNLDKQYLVWGDNNGSDVIRTPIAKPLRLGKRMQRLWRVQISNNFSQPVTVYYPTSALTNIFGNRSVFLVHSNVENFNSTQNISIPATGTQTINGIDYTSFRLTFPSISTPFFMSFAASYRQVMVNPAAISTNLQNRRIK